MPVPRPIIQKLMKATCDKTDLDKKILRLSRSFREVHELLGNYPRKK